MPPSKPLRFVEGFPTNVEKKQKARTIIKSHASRHRWPNYVDKQAESDSTAPSLRTKLTPFTTSRTSKRPALQWPDSSTDQKTTNGIESKCEAVDVTLPRIPSYTSLTPVFPLDQSDTSPGDRLWEALDKIYRTWRQLMPSDVCINAIMHEVVTTKEVYYSAMLACMSWELPSQPIDAVKSWKTMIHMYTKAITQINDKISQGTSAAYSDSMILAVMLLYFLSTHPLDLSASSEQQARPSRTVATPRPDLHQGPLTDLRALQLGGGHVENGIEHRNGLEKMIELHGGIKAISTPGIAQSYSYGETTVSSGFLRTPRCEFVPYLDAAYLQSQLSARWRPDHPLRTMGTSFTTVFGVRKEKAPNTVSTVLNLMEKLALYSMQADDWVASRDPQPSLNVMADQRTMIQHAMMSLMYIHERSEFAEGVQSVDSTLRLCHLAGLAYSFLVVFPLSHAPFRQLVGRIRSVMTEHAEDHRPNSHATMTLMLWALCLTGIIVQPGTDDGDWVLATLDDYIGQLRIRKWQALRAVLLDFLWLPVTNDQDGVRLWSELVQFRKPLAKRWALAEQVFVPPT